MSCNGCRILRKGCSEECILRPCLQWIGSPDSQAHATLFVAKFFGRADLMSFISSVPLPQRPVLFQSLLLEACGRTVNPVSGAVGLLTSGNWNICQAAVDTVLHSGVPHPLPPEFLSSTLATPPPPETTTANTTSNVFDINTLMYSHQMHTVSYDGYSEMSGTTTTNNFDDNVQENRISVHGQIQKQLLNLFV